MTTGSAKTSTGWRVRAPSHIDTPPTNSTIGSTAITSGPTYAQRENATRVRSFSSIGANSKMAICTSIHRARMIPSTSTAPAKREMAYCMCVSGVALTSGITLRSPSVSAGMPQATATKNGRISAPMMMSAKAMLKALLMAIFAPPVSALALPTVTLPEYSPIIMNASTNSITMFIGRRHDVSTSRRG